MREQYIEYRDGETLLEGFLCYDESQPGPRPAVLITHAWGGRDEFVERKARRLAWQGYACFALDNYGKGVRGKTPEECSALMKPFMTDRRMLLKRLKAGLAAAQALPIIDSRRIAVMGFCFGGKCALDLARTGEDIAGVASFHGLFDPPGLPANKISAKVVCYHGWDDPMVHPDAVVALAKELTEAGADWQIHAYGHTGHGFTNPNATAQIGIPGVEYQAAAERRSFAALYDFLGELFG
jgi:dienelactone hydrolase